MRTQGGPLRGAYGLPEVGTVVEAHSLLDEPLFRQRAGTKGREEAPFHNSHKDAREAS